MIGAIRRADQKEGIVMSEKTSKFIETIGILARNEYMSREKWILPSICIAQAALESGWNLEAKTLFGIKGEGFTASTSEFYNGNYVQIKASFKEFPNVASAVVGYYDFLANTERYAGAINNKSYKDAVDKLIHTADGYPYATDPNYIQKVISIIEQYELTKHDEKVENTERKTRQAVVQKAQSWIGRNEADGSHKAIIDLYNRFTPHPRGYALKYSDPWCAGTVGAIAVDLGYTSIIPIECSCEKMIALAKEMGIWIEDDAHIPQPAEFVLYDWDDNGVGDNTGNSDHIGTVETINTAAGTFEVIEGNMSNAVGTRTMKINGKYIRGFISPRYDADGTVQTPADGKTVDEVAGEVIAGSWGNGSDRKERLEAAGYNYAAVQQKVNELCSGSSKKSVDEVAREVIAGAWGNGSDRKERLEAAGYNYAAVQQKVNALLQNG